MPTPSILVVPPPSLFRKLFSDTAAARLSKLGKLQFNSTDADWSPDELAKRMDDVDVLVTSWRTPRLTDTVLERAANLKLVAHSAGSVKFMLDETIFDRGVAVSSAGAAMIQPVAEMTVMLAMLMLRPVHNLDAGLREGKTWAEMKLAGVGEELTAQTVGIVGAGQIGRRVIEMLRAWNIAVFVYDPMLGEDEARRMGVSRVETIDELMPRCRIVSLHAPVLPETKHMIGGKQLALLRDGAILINTARAWLVDTDALTAELKRGRIRAAVDVYDEEPLPPNSPWRSMPNALIMPHIASSTTQCFHRQGDITVDEVERFARGEPLRYRVTAAMLATMA